tara:strand:- start:232 stop:648 length:417 start_codon:yes stop_codon:yes gene_type:complete
MPLSWGVLRESSQQLHKGKNMYYKKEEIEQHFQDYLEENRPQQQWRDGCPDDFDVSELHNSAFNEDYYIVGTYQAQQWLGDHAFYAIQVIKDYEESCFGGVSTDLCDPEKVVNMYAYIVGEQVVYEWFERLEKSAKIA